MRLFTHTMQRKLLLLLLLVGFIPAGVAVLHVHWGTIVGLEGILGTFLEERAVQTAGALDQALGDYYEAAGQLRSAAEAGYPADTVPSRVLLMFDEIAVVGRDGKPVEVWKGAGEGRFEIPAALRRPEARTELFLHETVDGRNGQSRLLFLTPLRSRPGQLLAVAVATPRIVAYATGGVPFGHSVSIHSNRGVHLGGPRVSQSLIQAVREQMASAAVAGWIAPPGAENQELVGYATPALLRSRRNAGLTSVDWLVLAWMDMGEAGALFSYLLWRSLLFGLFLAPVLVVLSYWLVRRFLRPVRQLHQQVDRIAGGDLSARVSITTGDELEDLGAAFNEMARSLDQSQMALEEQMFLAEAKARQISLVHNIAEALLAAFDLPHLFRTTHEQLGALIPHDALTAVIFEPEGAGARLYDFEGGVFEPGSLREARPFCERVLTDAERDHVLDAGTGGGALPPAGPLPAGAPVREEFRQLCVLPLRAEPGLIGALALARTGERRFADAELRMLVQISQVLGLAVEHIALYERTRNFAEELERKVAERAEELERAQGRLVQAERFAATGRLAAGIAHEINNPLGIIKNYLRILRDRLPQLDRPSAEALTVVNEELDRIARIIRSLLYFYRPSNLKQVELDLNEEVRALLPLMEAGFRRKRIRLETDLQEALPRPLLSPDHVRQVLLNLIKNAEDAVSDGGTIRISTRYEAAEGTGGMLTLVIADDGCGISEADRPHIFEPFYTSKRDGQGTGLGLSVTYGIIRNLHGTIEIDSTPGEGTTVTVRIPAAAGAIALPP